MTPFRIIQLDNAFPRTVTGSVDLDLVNKLLGASRTANKNMSATEKIVASLLSQILSVPVDEVTPHSDFFDLGGSSKHNDG